jgi:hypothetical protein
MNLDPRPQVGAYLVALAIVWLLLAPVEATLLVLASR